MTLIKCDPSVYADDSRDNIPYTSMCRGYKCESCNDTFAEIVKKGQSKSRQKCPSCKKNSLEVLILGAPLTFVEREPTTVGQLAERNSKKMGKSGVEFEQNQIKARQKQDRIDGAKQLQEKCPEGYAVVTPPEEHKPWYGQASEKTKKNIVTNNQEKLTKFIMTGEE